MVKILLKLSKVLSLERILQLSTECHKIMQYWIYKKLSNIIHFTNEQFGFFIVTNFVPDCQFAFLRLLNFNSKLKMLMLLLCSRPKCLFFDVTEISYHIFELLQNRQLQNSVCPKLFVLIQIKSMLIMTEYRRLEPSKFIAFFYCKYSFRDWSNSASCIMNFS